VCFSLNDYPAAAVRKGRSSDDVDAAVVLRDGKELFQRQAEEMGQQHSVDPLVTDDKDAFGALVHNADKGRDRPSLHVTEALSAGEAMADKIIFALSVLSRISPPDLLEAETFPKADVDLPESALLPDGQAGLSGDDLGRHQTSLKIAAVCGVKVDLPQAIGEYVSLPRAGGAERRVGLADETPAGAGRFRLRMPDQIDGCRLRGHLREWNVDLWPERSDRVA
jgi:hypothetical protein